MTETEYEKSCDHDGKACIWLNNDFPDIDDSPTWDSFCIKCSRYRDWSKDEYIESLI